MAQEDEAAKQDCKMQHKRSYTVLVFGIVNIATGLLAWKVHETARVERYQWELA
jgi:hypothetical protein